MATRRLSVDDAGTGDVGTAITNVTSELPSEEDLRRVRDHLTKHGWPVDFSL